MEFKLHIYEGRKVVKTYTTESIDLSLGVIYDVIDAFDFESMTSGNNKEMFKAIIKCKDQIAPFLMDIFDGLTAEEVRHTRTQNLIEVFRGMYNYAINELGIIGSKN